MWNQFKEGHLKKIITEKNVQIKLFVESYPPKSYFIYIYLRNVVGW